MQKHLDSTQKMTDKEIQTLKSHTEKSRGDYQNRLAEQRAVITNEHELNLEDTNYRYNRTLQELNNNMENRIQETKGSKLEQLAETERFNQNKIDTQRKNFQTTYSSESEKFDKLKKQQDSSFKKQRLDTYSRQNQELDKITTQGRQDYDKRTDDYQKGLKDQELLFEKDMLKCLKKNTEDYKKLEDLNKKAVNELKTPCIKRLNLLSHVKVTLFMSLSN